MAKARIETDDTVLNCDCEEKDKERKMSEYQKFMGECMAQHLAGRPSSKQAFAETSKSCARAWGQSERNIRIQELRKRRGY